MGSNPRCAGVAPVSLALASLALAASLAACGGEEDQATPSEPPGELLAAAAADPAASGDAEIGIAMDLRGDTPLEGEAGVVADGPFDLGDRTGLPRFSFEAEAEVAGYGIDTDVVSTGDDAYVVFFGENYRVGTERVARAEAALADAAGVGGGFGLDVASWFRDPAYAGTEEVGGTDTEKVEGTLDAQAAAADLSALAGAVGAPPFVTALAEGAGSGPVEAWVAYPDEGGDGTIRRLRAEFPFTIPPGQVALARGVESGTVTLNAEISDVGADVSIEPPEGGGFQPIEQLTDRLESLASLGGL